MMVPAFLFGDEEIVKNETDDLLRQVLQTKSWTAALSKQEMLKSNSKMVIEPNGPLYDSENSARLYLVIPRLQEVAKEGLKVQEEPDRLMWFERLRDTLLSGSAYPWFCVSILGFGGMLLPEHPMKLQQNKNIMLDLARSALDQWEAITGPQYNIGGMLWAAQASKILYALGVAYFPSLSDGHEEAIARLHLAFLTAVQPRSD